MSLTQICRVLLEKNTNTSYDHNEPQSLSSKILSLGAAQNIIIYWILLLHDLMLPVAAYLG